MKTNINNYKDNEIIKEVKDLNDFENILKKSNRCFLFRGHFDDDWKLESSYKRWIRKLNNFDDDERLPSKYLVETITEQIKFIQNRSNENNNELEILAKLQHYGSPTLLIDFTTNFWNAIWFAVSENNSKPNEYFRIFYFELTNNKKIKYNISKLNDKNIYSCPDNIQNGLAQKSYFILDNLDNLKKEWNIKSIRIPFEKRSKLLKFLDINEINSSTIFPGLQGLYQIFQNYSKESILSNGVILGKLDKLSEALNCFDKVIELDSNDAGAYSNKAVILRKKGEYEEALANYNKAIERDPYNNIPYNNMGIFLSDTNKLNEALEYFNKAIEINPNNIITHINIGIIHFKKENYHDAIKCFDYVISLDPLNSIAYDYKGLVLNKENRNNESLKYFNKSLELDPNNSSAYNNKGNLLCKIKEIDKGIECFDEALRIDPNNPINSNIYCNKGGAFLEIKKYEEAIECFDKAIEINPKNGSFYFNKSIALNKLLDYDQAISSLNKAIYLIPNFIEGYFSLANIYSIKNKIELEIKCYEKIIKIDPNNKEAMEKINVIKKNMK